MALTEVERYAERLRRYPDRTDRRSAFVGMVEWLSGDDGNAERVVFQLKALVEALHQVEQPDPAFVELEYEQQIANETGL